MSALTSVTDYCPYCGELIELLIDESEPEQHYIEDCSVCCRPIVVSVTVPDGAAPELNLRSEDD